MTLRAEVGEAEGRRLLALSRRTRSVVTLRRCNIVLHSAQGFSAPKIGELLGIGADHVRTVIKAWNVEGFAALEPKYAGGRPRIFTDDVRDRLVSLATSRPSDLDLPFREWSLSRLRDEAIARGIVRDISREWLRVILEEAALSFQEAKTWKKSKDPEFHEKKDRIERLTRKKHNPPVVVAVDEMGPITLTPKKGKGWHKVSSPHRIPAEYHKGTGARYWFGAFHVGGNKLWGRIETKKGAKPWLRFLQNIRNRFPREIRIHIIQDNLSAHWTQDIKAWARKNRVSLVATPTNSSWLNPIECRFTELQDLAFSGSDYHDWPTVSRALRRAAAYRNRRALRRRASPRNVTRPLWTRH